MAAHIVERRSVPNHLNFVGVLRFGVEGNPSRLGDATIFLACFSEALALLAFGCSCSFLSSAWWSSELRLVVLNTLGLSSEIEALDWNDIVSLRGGVAKSEASLQARPRFAAIYMFSLSSTSPPKSPLPLFALCTQGSHTAKQKSTLALEQQCFGSHQLESCV